MARPNDQRTPAGVLIDGGLRVELEAVEADWLPRGPDGPRVRTTLFRELGGEPLAPGPLIRVRAGTRVRVSVHNRLDRPIAVRGLSDRLPTAAPPPDRFAQAGMPGALPAFVRDRPLVVAPGETTETTFTPTRPVSSFYFARTFRPEGGEEALSGTSAPGLDEGLFMGALVVDPAGTAPDVSERVLMITRWNPPLGGGDWKMTVNGLAWPFTERLEYTVGDTVHWRVINASNSDHPMHLHGFYFGVDAQGDTQADTVYAEADRPRVVTRFMQEFSSMRLTWVTERPGNWLFHCHLVRHMGEEQGAGFWPGTGDAEPGAVERGGMDGMAGLITGITIRPRAGETRPTPVPERRIDLWTGSRPNVYGDAPELGFVVQDGAVPPPDSTRVPGSPLILRRGEPTEIIVHNRLEFPLSVHWHGLELPSLYDGVGGWSGRPGSTRPAVTPGDSVRVVITPVRAGSFMYHTHGEPGLELSQGLYGPFLVFEPGQPRDPEMDRVFILAARGATFHAAPAINGRTRPEPERFEPGRTYRLRFLQIASDESKRIRLLRDGVPTEWRPVAKDGADLENVPGTVPATVGLGVGETYDVTWTPQPGIYVLEVATEFFADGSGGTTIQSVGFAVGPVAEALLNEATRRVEALVPAGPAEAARFGGTYVGTSPSAPGIELRMRIFEEEGAVYSTSPLPGPPTPERLYVTGPDELAIGRAQDDLVRLLRFRVVFEEGGQRAVVTDAGAAVATLRRVGGS